MNTKTNLRYIFISSIYLIVLKSKSSIIKFVARCYGVRIENEVNDI